MRLFAYIPMVLAVAGLAAGSDRLIEKDSVAVKVIRVRGHQVDVSVTNKGDDQITDLTVQCEAANEVKLGELLVVERAAGEASLPAPLASRTSAVLHVDLRTGGFRSGDVRCVAYAKLSEDTAAQVGAQKFDSGLVYVDIKTGDGPSPKDGDVVTVHYHGTLRDGTVFDSSVERNMPATFPLNRVIKCWTEGVQKMRVGGKARLLCPADIAYGKRGAPPKIPPNTALVFEIELLEIKEKATAPRKPAEHP